MVDVLDASGANRPKPGLITTPTSTISPEEMVRPQLEAAQGLRGLGQALGTLGEQIDMATVPAAQAAGAAAVGRDENGEPTVELRPFAISASDRAFNAAATQGLISKAQMDAQRGLQEIAAKYPSDPVGFDAEAKTFVRGLGAGARDLRPVLQADADKIRQQHFLSIQNAAVRRQTGNAKDAILVQIDTTTSELFALARKGGIDTDEYRAASERLGALYTDLKANPLFEVAPARADAELQSTADRARGFGMAGEAVRIFDAEGEKAAQKWLVEQVRDNPNLKITDAQRSGLVEIGRNAIAMRKGENKAAVDANKATANVLAKALEDGKAVPAGSIESAIDIAAKLGDTETAAKLITVRQVYGRSEFARGLSDEERVRLATSPPAAGAVPSRIYTRLLQGGLSPIMAFGLMGNLSMESSFNTGARNPGDGRDGSDSIGIAQWNSDRARALSAFAASRGKPVTDVETQADFIIHELNTTEGRARAALASARTPEEAGRAAIGYFRPAGFSWANPDGAHNSGKRIEQARVLAATLGGASPEAARAAAQSRFTPEQLAENPYLASTWLRSQMAGNKEMIDSAKYVMSAASNAIDKGTLPESQALAGALQIAEQNPAELGRARDELIAKIRGFDEGEEANRQGRAAGAALVQDAMRRAQGAPIFVQMQAEAVKAAVERGARNLREQPWEEAARRGWSSGALPALDFTSADGFAAGLAARSGVATSISARTGEAQSVLSPTDTADLQGVWRNGTPEQRAMVAQQIGQLPDEQFRLVIEDSEVRDSLIGMSRSGDATKMAPAFALMDRAQRIDPDGFNKTYGRAIENRLAAWTSRMAYMSPEELAREAMRENDPAMKKVRDELRGQAEEKVKKLTAGEIASYFDASWLPFSSPDAPLRAEDAARFAADYKAEFASTFADVGDEAKARELTVQRLGRVWAPSAVNGGRLTKFAPEKSPAYPPINGSHDWLKKQFDESVRAVLGDMGAAPAAKAMLSAPRMLVPDARTEAEFNAGRPPSYAVVVQAPNGMFLPLQNAQGRQARFTADADAVIEAEREAAQRGLDALRNGWAAQERAETELRRQADVARRYVQNRRRLPPS